MPDVIPDQVIKSVKVLCSKSIFIEKFFEDFSVMKKNVITTTVDSLVSNHQMSRTEAIDTLKRIADTNCGEYKIGRRGKKTRLDWKYSTKNLGLGLIQTGSQLNQALIVSEEGREDEVPELTISNAKKLLAKSLGIKPEQVEIQIKV